MQTLRELGETLLDVHGQMEYQSLVKRAAQRALLDASGELEFLVAQVASLWRELAQVRAARQAMIDAAKDRAERIDLLRYHLDELRALDLKEKELDALTQERQRLAQGERLARGAVELTTLLREADEVSAEQLLSKAVAQIRGLADIDARLHPVRQLLDESAIALREAIDQLMHYQRDLDADPQRQEWVEQRLAAIESIARKHRTTPDALTALRVQFEGELSQLEHLEASLEEINGRLAIAQERFAERCKDLSAKRRRAARELEQRITALMQTLGMPGGQFKINVQTAALDQAGAHGADDIEFLVSANPGQPPKPLARVASGGELSRISLAIQVAAVQKSAASCLIFDEVDAGVGGGVAQIVGQQLRALGDRAQVLCVTHLPQVASQAHAQVRVSKLTDGKTTRTTLQPLNADERVAEIARMLGGVEITDKAREHAAEMLGLKPLSARKKSGRGSN